MYKHKVLITPFIESINNEEAFRLLDEAGCEIKVHYFDGQCLTEKEIGRLIEDMDGVIAAGEPYTKAVLDRAKKLKVISRTGVGYDKIDIQTATEKGIVVTITPGIISEAVAALAFALILSLARHIPECDRDIKHKKWVLRPGINIGNKTLGIIGLGAIGKALVSMAKGFNMKIIAYDLAPDRGFATAKRVTLTTFNEVLSQADFVSIHLPLNEKTKYLIGENEFKLMKPTAYLINTSRGAIINEKALVKALRRKWIRGAGLDVFEHEPPWDSQLLRLDNVVLSPHIGGSTEESLSLMGKLASENVVKVLKGETPHHIVNLDPISFVTNERPEKWIE